jgi:hypothetical protein
MMIILKLLSSVLPLKKNCEREKVNHVSAVHLIANVSNFCCFSSRNDLLDEHPELARELEDELARMANEKGQLEQNVQDTASQLGALNNAAASYAEKTAQNLETQESSDVVDLDATPTEVDALNNAANSDSVKDAPKLETQEASGDDKMDAPPALDHGGVIDESLTKKGETDKDGIKSRDELLDLSFLALSKEIAKEIFQKVKSDVQMIVKIMTPVVQPIVQVGEFAWRHFVALAESLYEKHEETRQRNIEARNQRNAEAMKESATPAM